MVETVGTRRIDQRAEQRFPDPLAARFRADIEVRDVRSLAAAIAEHAEDEPDGAIVVFRHEGGAVADGSREIGPCLLPGLLEVRRPAQLLLELFPELAQEVTVAVGGASDRHE